MSGLGLSIACVVGFFPASFLVDCPYGAYRGRIKAYISEGVVDGLTLLGMLILVTQVSGAPPVVAASVSVGLYVMKMIRGLRTCFSGAEVSQPVSLLGELWLCCSALVGIGVIALGALAPLLSF